MPNKHVNLTAQRRCRWVPSALRAPAAGYVRRWAPQVKGGSVDRIIASCARSMGAALVAGVALGTAGLSQVLAADYPVKPIRLIVAFPAGGPTDLAARQLGQLLSARLAQQFVIDNRPGASGAIGTRIAAAAAPDGYTLLFCNSPTHSVNPAMMQNLGYDVEKDFAPIARTATVPFILAVNSSLPVRSVGELVNLAKAKPGTLRYGSAGPATITHVAGELLAHKTRIKLVHVPYKGLAPAITDAIGGHIDMVFMTPREGLPQLRTGRLRALAVTSARRLTVLPEVPTMDESGLKEGELLAWGGLCAPKGTPPEIIKRLNAEAMAAYRSPSLKNELEREGFELVANTPEEFAQFMKADRAYIAGLVKQFDIRADE